MAKKKKQRKKKGWFGTPKQNGKSGTPEPLLKDFLDMIAPGAVQFNTDYYILGNSYRAAYALRSYPTSTEELALLRRLGSKNGVALHVFVSQVDAAEESKILHNAQNRNRMSQNTNDLKQTITAEANLRDVAALITSMQQNREPLVHCAVFIELGAPNLSGLKTIQSEIMAELVRSKLGADRIMLRQLDAFRSVNPAGFNAFGSQYERVLPASSVANLYPFNYSGKTDPHGFYIGRDRYGSNLIVDLDRRAEDKTNASVLILGNSGEGKSFLLKLLLINCLESGKTVICLDPELELEPLCRELGGCFADIMTGKYVINPLEPKTWNVDGNDDPDAPDSFRGGSCLSQHISFLKDFFRSYKDFSDQQLDAIELMLERLYRKWNMDDNTDFSVLKPGAFPILSDLYAVIQEAYQNYDQEPDTLYPRELLREVLLGLHAMCVGSESVFFNGHTNITSDRFLVFGVKQLLESNASVKNALLFNILSYMSDKLLTEGNTVATLDELYIWLSNRMTIEYIRNTLKRVRKKGSALIMASQNLEDFNVSGIRELTRPLFAIPAHQFIFHCGAVDKQFYMQNLQLEQSEYNHIRFPKNGMCIYKCHDKRMNVCPCSFVFFRFFLKITNHRNLQAHL